MRAALERARRPLLAEEVLGAAKQESPSLGLATVYRHLRVGLNDGWLQAVELPGAVTRYELSSREHHHHFHCRACNHVYDFHNCPGSLAELAPPGFRVDGHEVILYGICLKCASH